MKTEIEVSKMKDDLERKIQEYQKEMSEDNCSEERYINLRHIKIQYMAQYNILLEVLK